ncbi:hypothetical protein A4S06_08975 [Erysipelotrichaceae bacterium MTC7]|nr:hypothetical protein A4S06_08975 [Erysipelotrichaceae bacterium MTC7]
MKVLKRIGKILIVFLLLVACLYGFYKVRVSTSGNLNVLIIGIDAREGESVSRSDSLMLAHVNKNHKIVDLISIPRDSYVYIPAVDREEKITHAHAYAGIEGTIETVENLFDIQIDKYVEVDFTKMIALVDTLDGIDVTPTATFCEQDENDQADSYCFTEGEKEHMDGKNALAYARHRKSDSDFARAKRQQEVIKAMVSKVKSESVVTMFNFYQDVTKISDTDFGVWDIFGYADMAFHDFELRQSVGEGEGGMFYDAYYGQNLWQYYLNDAWLENTKILLQE